MVWLAGRAFVRAATERPAHTQLAFRNFDVGAYGELRRKPRPGRHCLGSPQCGTDVPLPLEGRSDPHRTKRPFALLQQQGVGRVRIGPGRSDAVRNLRTGCGLRRIFRF